MSQENKERRHPIRDVWWGLFVGVTFGIGSTELQDHGVSWLLSMAIAAGFCLIVLLVVRMAQRKGGDQ
ncbi:MAG: hypothetical protein ACRDPJ_12945 [Nocardioidaceae bacterium]